MVLWKACISTLNDAEFETMQCRLAFAPLFSPEQNCVMLTWLLGNAVYVRELGESAIPLFNTEQVERVLTALLTLLSRDDHGFDFWLSWCRLFDGLSPTLAPKLNQAQVERILANVLPLVQDDGHPCYIQVDESLAELALNLKREQRRMLLPILAQRAQRHERKERSHKVVFDRSIVLFQSLEQSRTNFTKIIKELNHTDLGTAVGHTVWKFHSQYMANAIKTLSINPVNWLQQPEAQPLNFRDVIAAAQEPASLAEVLLELTYCQTLRAGLPLILHLVELGVYKPVQQLFEAAVTAPAQSPINPSYQRVLVELLLCAKPELALALKFTDEQLLALVTSVYLSEETPRQIYADIELWLVDKNFKQLPPTMMNACLQRAIANAQAATPRISYTTMQLLAKCQLNEVNKTIVAILKVADSQPGSSASQQSLKDDFKKLPTHIVLTYYLDQQTHLSSEKKQVLASVLREKLAVEPLPIRDNIIVMGENEHLLPEELRISIMVGTTAPSDHNTPAALDSEIRGMEL
jgi:hypothetical protein